MPLLSQLWTDAALPLLSERQTAVYLAVGGMLGCVMAILAHLAWRDSGLEPWRRMRFVGGVLAPVQLGRALAAGLVPASEYQAVLAAAVSLLDLGLVALAAGAVVLLLPRPVQPRGKFALYAVLGLVLFLGLLGGDPLQSLLARNLPAAATHLAFFALIVMVMVRKFVSSLYQQRDEARSHSRLLADQTGALRAELAIAVSTCQAAEARAAEDHDTTREANRRSRMLEQLLAGTVDLQARRDQQDWRSTRFRRSPVRTPSRCAASLRPTSTATPTTSWCTLASGSPTASWSRHARRTVSSPSPARAPTRWTGPPASA